MARVLLVCFESVPLPGAGCVPVSGRFGLAWLRSVVPKLRGARWWEVAPAGGVAGTLWTESPMEPEPLSSWGSWGELWPGWRPGGLDVAAPPCLWSRGGRSECLLPGCGLVPPRLPSREPWTEAFRPHLTCSPARLVGSCSRSPVL